MNQPSLSTVICLTLGSQILLWFNLCERCFSNFFYVDLYLRMKNLFESCFHSLNKKIVWVSCRKSHFVCVKIREFAFVRPFVIFSWIWQAFKKIGKVCQCIFDLPKLKLVFFQCCWNELPLPLFTFCRNETVTMMIVSSKFPGLSQN